MLTLWPAHRLSIGLLAVAVAASTAIVVGILRYGPTPAWPWFVMALSFLVSAVPLSVHYGAEEPAAPWFAVAVLFGYGLAVVSMAGLLCARFSKNSYSLLLDGLVLSAAVATIAWSTLPDLIIPGSPVSGFHGGAVTLLSLDVALIYLLLSLSWPIRGFRHQPWALRGAVLIAVLFAVHSLVLVTIALVPAFAQGQVGQVVLAAVRLAVPVVVGIIGLMPSMRTLTEAPRRRWTGQIGPLKAAVLVGVLLAATWVTIAGAGAARSVGAAALVSLTFVALATRLTRDANALAAVSDTLAHEAAHDALTGLPNRSALQRHTAAELSRTARRDEGVAVIFIDLDRFKRVNDTLGHAVGDLLLQAAAQRVAGAARQGDFVARAGGDEFVVVLSGPASGDAGMAVAERVVACLEEPIDLGVAQAVVGASAGVAIGGSAATLDTDTGADAALAAAAGLIRDADVAMYAAKQRGGRTVCRHDDRMRRSLERQVEIESQLTDALADGRVVAHYQPIVDLLDGDAEGRPRVRGYEALARWVDGNQVVHAPSAFLEAADRAGLVPQIDVAVLEAAVASIARWRQVTGDPLWVAVNITPVHLDDAGLPARVAEILDVHGLPGEALVLEITEKALIDDVPAARLNIAALSRLGVAVALDDFGTGYSGLAWLRDLPVRYVKIDRSFVQADTVIAEDARAAAYAIVASVTDMAHRVNARVIGEGIETVEHEDRMRALGVDMAQGYRYGAPWPAADVEDGLRELHRVSANGLNGLRKASARG